MKQSWHLRQPVLYFLIIVLSLFRFEGYAQNTSPRPSGGQSEERLAMQYFQQRDFGKSADILKRLFQDQKKPYLYSYYFVALTELKNYDEAKKIARQMQKQYPGQIAWEVDEAYAEYMAGNTRKAERQFNSLIRNSVASQQLITQTANAFRSRNLTTQALAVFELAREKAKDPNAYLSEIASIYEIAGDYKSAVETYIKLLLVNKQTLETIKGRLQFSLVQDIDNERSTFLKQKLLSAIQKNSDSRELSELLLWLSLQQKDFATAFTQARALNARFGTDGQEIFQLAKISWSNADEATALEALNYLVKKYPGTAIGQDANLLRIDIHYNQFVNKATVNTEEKKNMETELRKNLKTNTDRYAVLRLSRYLAHLLSFYSDRTEEAIVTLDTLVAREVNASTEKLELADIYLFAGKIWDANLLYAQVDKEMREEEMGQEARFRQAKLSFYIGEFDWAKSQLDILKSATSRLIANDAMELSLLIADNIDPDSTYTTLKQYARAEMLAYRKKFKESLALLDTISGGLPGHPILDEVLLKKAGIYEETGDYKTADSLYNRLYRFYPEGIWADKALLTRARLLDYKMNNPKAAAAVYETLIIRFGGSYYADEARRRYREINAAKPHAIN